MRDFLTAIDEGLSRRLPVTAATTEVIEEHVRVYKPEEVGGGGGGGGGRRRKHPSGP